MVNSMFLARSETDTESRLDHNSSKMVYGRSAIRHFYIYLIGTVKNYQKETELKKKIDFNLFLFLLLISFYLLLCKKENYEKRRKL